MDQPSLESLVSQLDGLLSEEPDAAAARARTAFDRETAPFNDRIVLHGAGNMGRRVLARLRQDGIEPLAFSDNQESLWGTNIDGIEVQSPASCADLYGDSASFVVTIYNHRHNFLDTRRLLSTLGCGRVVSVIPLRWKYSDTFLPYYRDDLPDRVLLQRDAVTEAFGFLSDLASRREFVAQVEWRLKGDFSVLGTPVGNEYFPRDVIRLTKNEVFVDVGAYDGDTLRAFLANTRGVFHRAFALEPDPGNYSRLADFVARLPAEMGSKIRPLPLAASNRHASLRFSNGTGTSAALSNEGAILVDCVRLDDLLQGEHPTYIKMDIEGAELDAIEGSRRILADERPLVAACVYHAQDHLWQIPIAIRRANSGYRLFLRPHMFECWETVCYAVPPEREVAS